MYKPPCALGELVIVEGPEYLAQVPTPPSGDLNDQWFRVDSCGETQVGNAELLWGRRVAGLRQLTSGLDPSGTSLAN